MRNEPDIFRDPRFQRLLARRSRWRWALSGGLIGIYFAYCLGGIYFNDALARPALGTSISLSIALGYLIILLSIVLSIVYIRVVGRFVSEPFDEEESGQ